ncbi:MAG: serine hydrolase [Pseudobutyrivibrio sp.]|nr:serine hydrolase [Pseudobutyrivibrio sp.]
MKNKFIKSLTSITCLGLISVLLLTSPLATIKARAASYAVTPANGVLLTGNGAEIFTDANPATCINTVRANIPVQVTGQTTNGYWQVNIAGSTYYMHGTSLSMQQNTTALKQTSFDAKAALLMNVKTGQPIYAQGILDKVEPASTAKIMTVLLVVEAIEAGTISLDTPVVASATALASLPSDASHMDPKIQVGEVLTVDQLLTAVMVSSDCQACNVLAELIAGSVPAFANLMNTRAAQIGCTNTNFTNPSGYPDKNMYTNAYSLYLITATAIGHPIFNQYFGTQSTVLAPSSMVGPRPLVNTNSLLDPASIYYNPAVFAGKTGTANRAGQCLVCVANQGGKTEIGIIMGAKNRTLYDGSKVSMRYYEMNRLLNLGK